MNIDVVIPALNEEAAVGDVVRAIPRPPVRNILVADNGSTDRTAETAMNAGAQVVSAPERGYGAACLAALAHLPVDCDIVVFLDADGSDEPSELSQLVQPIVDDQADLVVGSRALGNAEAGSLTPPQVVGNTIASTWLRTRFGLHATDLGPFRAIRRTTLDALKMADRNYGWTVEMQLKAAFHRVRYAEIPVSYKKRVGQSKVSGTVRGVVGASYKILGLLAYHDFSRTVFGRRSV